MFEDFIVWWEKKFKESDIWNILTAENDSGKMYRLTSAFWLLLNFLWKNTITFKFVILY